MSALPDPRPSRDEATAPSGHDASGHALPARPAPESPRRTIAFLLGVSLLVFGLFYGVLKKSRPTLWNDTYEYAQVARNVALGRGLKTDAVTVLEAWFLGRAGLPPPYFLHDPGNSLLLGGAFRLFGARNAVIGWTGGLFFVLLAPLTYALGRELFPRPVALLAGLLVAVNAQLLLFAAAGYSEVPSAFFLTLLLVLLVDARAPRRLLLAGVVYGLLVLLRANSLALLPLVLLFVFAGEPAVLAPSRWSRLRPCLAFLAGFAAVLAPNALRNYRSTGSPFQMVSSFYTLVYYTSAVRKATGVFSQPGLDVDPIAFVLTHPGELLSKMGWQLSREVLNVLEGGLGWQRDFASSLCAFLFLVALLVPPSGEDPSRRRFRLLVGASVVTTLVVGSAFHLRWRHAYLFLPVAMLFAAESLVRMVSPERAARGSVRAFLLVLVAAYGAGPIVHSVRKEAPLLGERNRSYRQLATFVRDATPADAVVLMDVSGGRFNPLGNAIAWYGERTVVQYAPTTLAAPFIRDAKRPLFGLLVRPEGTGGAFHDGVPPEARVDRAAGFLPVSDWSGTLGEARLLRWSPGPR